MDLQHVTEDRVIYDSNGSPLGRAVESEVPSSSLYSSYKVRTSLWDAPKDVHRVTDTPAYSASSWKPFLCFFFLHYRRLSCHSHIPSIPRANLSLLICFSEQV